jgi:hypothetical protein
MQLGGFPFGLGLVPSNELSEETRIILAGLQDSLNHTRAAAPGYALQRSHLDAFLANHAGDLARLVRSAREDQKTRGANITPVLQHFQALDIDTGKDLASLEQRLQAIRDSGHPDPLAQLDILKREVLLWSERTPNVGAELAEVPITAFRSMLASVSRSDNVLNDPQRKKVLLGIYDLLGIDRRYPPPAVAASLMAPLGIAHLASADVQSMVPGLSVPTLAPTSSTSTQPAVTPTLFRPQQQRGLQAVPLVHSSSMDSMTTARSGESDGKAEDRKQINREQEYIRDEIAKLQARLNAPPTLSVPPVRQASRGRRVPQMVPVYDKSLTTEQRKQERAAEAIKLVRALEKKFNSAVTERDRDRFLVSNAWDLSQIMVRAAENADSELNEQVRHLNDRLGMRPWREITPDTRAQYFRQLERAQQDGEYSKRDGILGRLLPEDEAELPNVQHPQQLARSQPMEDAPDAVPLQRQQQPPSTPVISVMQQQQRTPAPPVVPVVQQQPQQQQQPVAPPHTQAQQDSMLIGLLQMVPISPERESSTDPEDAPGPTVQQQESVLLDQIRFGGSLAPGSPLRITTESAPKYTDENLPTPPELAAGGERKVRFPSPLAGLVGQKRPREDSKARIILNNLTHERDSLLANFESSSDSSSPAQRLARLQELEKLIKAAQSDVTLEDAEEPSPTRQRRHFRRRDDEDEDQGGSPSRGGVGQAGSTAGFSLSF